MSFETLTKLRDYVLDCDSDIYDVKSRGFFYDTIHKHLQAGGKELGCSELCKSKKSRNRILNTEIFKQVFERTTPNPSLLSNKPIFTTRFTSSLDVYMSERHNETDEIVNNFALSSLSSSSTSSSSVRSQKNPKSSEQSVDEKLDILYEWVQSSDSKLDMIIALLQKKT